MESMTTKRSLKLIAEFADGFADGWHMAVKESYKMELDIKLLERKEKQVASLKWTQGPYYCFSEGQVFYDSKLAYNDCDWKTSLEHINIACRIVEAKPNLPEKVYDESSGNNTFKVSNGFVKFVLYKPNPDRTQLIGFVGYNLTQNQFVTFLRTGQL